MKILKSILAPFEPAGGKASQNLLLVFLILATLPDLMSLYVMIFNPDFPGMQGLTEELRAMTLRQALMELLGAAFGWAGWFFLIKRRRLFFIPLGIFFGFLIFNHLAQGGLNERVQLALNVPPWVAALDQVLSRVMVGIEVIYLGITVALLFFPRKTSL